jgi:hypothetical protein
MKFASLITVKIWSIFHCTCAAEYIIFPLFYFHYGDWVLSFCQGKFDPLLNNIKFYLDHIMYTTLKMLSFVGDFHEALV